MVGGEVLGAAEDAGAGGVDFLLFGCRSVGLGQGLRKGEEEERWKLVREQSRLLTS